MGSSPQNLSSSEPMDCDSDGSLFHEKSEGDDNKTAASDRSERSPRPPGKSHSAQLKGELHIQNLIFPGHALLIGCDHGRLQGTKNDVEAFSSLLLSHGFQIENITILTGSDAKRTAIENVWRSLLGRITEHDAVVIYYSGHGGYATSETAQNGLPTHFQFLVPSDFKNDDPPGSWKGMLDIEVSRLLFETTARTKNVTYILDCCHSSRLGKAPSHIQDVNVPVPKSHCITLDGTIYAKIWMDAKARCEAPDTGGYPDFTEPDYCNPDVVRIAAAAAESSAWQRYNSDGSWSGMMTDSLVKVLPVLGEKKSWQSIMLVVGELVKREFSGDPQQPRCAGADSRLPFSMRMDRSASLWADIHEDSIVIQGGKALGVQVGDIFTLTQWDKIGYPAIEVQVTDVYGFAAEAKHLSTEAPSPGVAYATLQKRSRAFPVALRFSDGVDVKQVSGNFVSFAAHNVAADCEYIAELRQDGSDLVLYGRDTLYEHTERSVQLATWPRDMDIAKGMVHLSQCVEDFARARNIIALGAGIKSELFRPRVSITLGRFSNETESALKTIHARSTTSTMSTQPLQLEEDDRVYFDLKSELSEDETGAVYITVLAVDATGHIRILSVNQGEKGIRLSHTEPEQSLRRDGRRGKGLPIHWPEGILTRNKSVIEHFVLVLTKHEVDLRFLESPSPESIVEAKGPIGQFFLEPTNRYQVISIRYILSPKLHVAQEEGALTSSELPPPEGAFDETVRFRSRRPPTIRVVNQHRHDITVVVSKYKPQRRITAGGVQVSPSGAGLNIESTTYLLPATQKTLASEQKDPQRCSATFPLWTRGDGYGVISIFIGAGASFQAFALALQAKRASRDI
ncbi:hypothetical protein NQ176_g3233 [Zarea fungicola]|uniref:Uncharacterized protein n=1 Tax=Zarea fungicola TaxID=93591 RepID=A0ACC1NLL4_9HYPO|nr:hypothetical protein NQ176_g3233 [Lecanicillium fungicola]